MTAILITEDLRDLHVQEGWESTITRALTDAGFTPEFWDATDETVRTDVEGILVNAPTVGVAELDRFPNLRVLVRFGSGVDNIDLAECERRGITMRNIPGPIAADMAGAIAGIILDKLFEIRHKEEAFRAAGWNTRRSVTSIGAARATVGIVGAGRIAAHLAPVLHALGSRVCFASASLSQGDGTHIGEKLELDELCRVSDVVVVLSPLRDDTRGLIGVEQIARMGGNSHLIAMSRGGVVDEQAAIAALQRGTIGSVHLDVFEGEPVVPAHYHDIPGLTVTPHNAAWSGTFFHETLREAVVIFRESLGVPSAVGGAP